MAPSLTEKPSFISLSASPPEVPTDVEPFRLPKVELPIDAISASMATEAARRDVRSDVVTTPTPAIMQAMSEAGGGDNVMQEDVTTNSFEATIAALCGKEAGLYVPSGTLSNQLCLRTWLTQPPYSVLCDARSHIHRYEAGGVAFHSGAALDLLKPSNGLYLRWDQDILPNLSLDHDIHFAPTQIVSLENTLNGTIYPQEEIVKISKELTKVSPGGRVKLHLDGARLWNVAAETGMSLKELCEPFDSVSLCFSKGLGAPIGSMMIGPQDFIHKATHFRKLFGAGMRQAGVITAGARAAITDHFNKLKWTHDLAKWTASQMRELGVEITAPVETNMVFIDTTPLGFSPYTLRDRALQLPKPIKMGGPRIVIHHQVDPNAMAELVDLVKQLKKEFKGLQRDQSNKGLENFYQCSKKRET